MERQRAKNSQLVNNLAALLDIKIYYKAFVIRTVEYWLDNKKLHKYTQMDI